MDKVVQVESLSNGSGGDDDNGNLGLILVIVCSVILAVDILVGIYVYKNQPHRRMMSKKKSSKYEYLEDDEFSDEPEIKGQVV